ncbi:hypothetical protein HDU77_000323 [Chytriomyces hyalinus]|nr:hypothetical protein HDU77_000323 [Chytriomyces hyalinus]
MGGHHLTHLSWHECNGLGPPAASVNIYKSFIWHVLKYDTALKTPSAKMLKVYKSVHTRNTSTAALHKLLQVEAFKHHATELNLMWSSCLHNSTNCSIPAARIWHSALLGVDLPFQECLPRLAHLNPLMYHPDAKWIDHCQEPLVPPPLAEVPFKHPPKPPKALTDTIRKELQKEAIVNLDNNPDTIAGAIQVKTDNGI